MRLISKLTGPDSGPQFNVEDTNCRTCYDWYSIITWKKKVICSSGHRMIVEFHSAIASQFDRFSGFSAFISYSLLENKKECIDGLDMENGILKSPNHPNLYGNNISCNWLITVGYGFHITLTFTYFNVRLILKIFNPMFQSFMYFVFYNSDGIQ